MKITRLLKGILIAFLLVGLTGVSPAQQKNKQVEKKEHVEKTRIMHKQHNRLPRIPNLTDDQRSQIKGIMLDTRQQVLPLQNQMREKTARLKTLRTEEKVDMNAVNNVIEDIGDLRTEIMKIRVASEQEVRELLNEEQRIVYDSRKVHTSRHHIMKHHLR